MIVEKKMFRIEKEKFLLFNPLEIKKKRRESSSKRFGCTFQYSDDLKYTEKKHNLIKKKKNNM